MSETESIKDENLLFLIKKWCYQTTMDGPPNIVQARGTPTLFAFWIIMFSFCSSLCVYVVVGNVRAYYDYEVITSDRVVAYESIEFPMITFCNQNPFLHPQASETIRGYLSDTFGVNVTSSAQAIDLIGLDNYVKEIYWFLHSLQNPALNDTLRKSMGYSAEDTFLRLTFNRKTLNVSNVTRWFFDPMYGNCYRIDLNGLNASREGYGLYAEIFLGLPYDQHDYFFEPITKGLRIEIKDADNYPFVFNSVLASPGALNTYEMFKATSRTQPRPYSKCSSRIEETEEANKSALVRELVRQGIEYNRGICTKFYFQNWTIHTFGCYNLFYPRLLDDKSPPCSNKSLNESLFNSDKYLMDAAIKQCPLDCDVTIYDYFYSFATFPTEAWYQERKVHDRVYLERLFGAGTWPSFESMRSCFTAVYIVFRNIVVEEINESPAMLMIDLLSNIGGTLGLFIGPSLLTLTELFEIVFDYVAILWRRRQRRRQQFEINDLGGTRRQQSFQNGCLESELGGRPTDSVRLEKIQQISV